MKLIFELSRTDKGLWKSLQKAESPCECVSVLTPILEELNPPPKDSQKWLKDQCNISTSKSQKGHSLLSTVLPGHEELVGKQISEDKIAELQEISNIPLRFWLWNQEIKDLDVDTSKQEHSKQDLQSNKQTEELSVSNPAPWIPNEGLDMEAVGIRESKKDIDLQGFKLIRGKGIVGTNSTGIECDVGKY